MIWAFIGFSAYSVAIFMFGYLVAFRDAERIQQQVIEERAEERAKKQWKVERYLE